MSWVLFLGMALGVLAPVLSCARATADPAGSATASPAPALTQRWLALRPLQGHFDGAQWNDAVDRWQGAKHSLMQQMARYAFAERLDCDRLSALLGAPDQVLPAGDAAQMLFLQQVQWEGVPAGDLWLYRWRGAHDQLVFALSEGQVVAAGWWYAFE